MNALVTAADLATHPQWRVFDCRHDLGDPSKGLQAYRLAHIPNALHAHLDQDLSATKTGFNGRHPLPTASQFAQWLGRCGVRNTDFIVAYDDASGAYAARLWWMLRWIGHANVAVLDGGFAAWTRDSRPVTTDVPRFEPTTFAFEERSDTWVGTADVLANLDRQAMQIVDARGANRFAGRDETIDPVAGHIPSALNRPFTDNLGADGRFKSPRDLRSEFESLLQGRSPATIVHQCGSGVTACHNLLAMEVAGLEGSRLYPGSWSEWCSDPSRPIATSA